MMAGTRRFKSTRPLLAFCLSIITVAIAAGSPQLAWATKTSSPPGFNLSIIHTNDFHAHDEPFRENGKVIGGASRMAKLIRDLRKSSIDNTLLIDGGDIFQGSILYAKYKGEVEVELLNKMGYDIYTIGNHEFDDGSKNLADKLSKAKFDVVNCNLDFSKMPGLGKIAKPYVIKEFGKEKVAFIGAITNDLEVLAANMQEVKLKAKDKSDWMNPIKDTVKELKEQGINKIIMVTHCGVEDDEALAKAIPELDAIIGGHSHSRLTERMVIKHADGTTTTIVQAGCYGKNVGKLDLNFDSEGRVVDKNVKYKLHPVENSIEPAEDIDEYLREKVKPILHLRKEVLANCMQDFGEKVAPCDTAMGDFVCDALARAGRHYGVTISFHNRGGMRGVFQQGSLTREELEQVLPFDNFVVFATVKGSLILKTLEHGMSGLLGARFLDVHGLKIAYDRDLPPERRVVFVLHKDQKGKWVDLKPEQDYKIAINHYNFEGGERYNFEGATNVVKSEMRIADAVRNYLLQERTITPQKPNRIVAVASNCLSVTGSGDDATLSFKGADPEARLTLVAGDARGVSTIYDAFPTPVQNATVIETKILASKDGEYHWKGVGKLIKKTMGEKGAGYKWVTVVAHPPKQKGESKVEKGSKTIIAVPVELK